MANRAGLYSINEIPGTAAEQTLTLKSLSETSYAVPLSYILLVSGDSLVCDSLITEEDERICVAGNYQKGVAALEKYVHLALDLPFLDAAVLQFQLEETLAFLSDPSVKQDYIYLDLAELAMMQEDVSLCADLVMQKAEELKTAIDKGDVSQVIPELFEYNLSEDKWLDAIGLESWQTVLFNEFPEPFVYTTPFQVIDLAQRKADVSDLAQRKADVSDLAAALSRIT